MHGYGRKAFPAAPSHLEPTWVCPRSLTTEGLPAPNLSNPAANGLIRADHLQTPCISQTFDWIERQYMVMSGSIRFELWTGCAIVSRRWVDLLFWSKGDHERRSSVPSDCPVRHCCNNVAALLFDQQCCNIVAAMMAPTMLQQCCNIAATMLF